MNGERENKRRDALEAETAVERFEEGADVTDKQDLTFRYST